MHATAANAAPVVHVLLQACLYPVVGGYLRRSDWSINVMVSKLEAEMSPFAFTSSKENHNNGTELVNEVYLL